MVYRFGKIISISLSSLAVILGAVLSAGAMRGPEIVAEEPQVQDWSQVCDGVTVTKHCTADDGLKYNKYIYHEAEPEVTEEIVHPAEPAKTHTVHHPATYGTRQVNIGCVKTTISNKSGSCALSQCRDGEYSGSTGRGTCSHHGGVLRSGGPWYIYRDEQYVVTPAWDETVVDVPAKPEWIETIVVTEAKEAYFEKELAEEQ